MKVLHVIDRLETGGAEKLFVSITKLLHDKSVHVGTLLFQSGSPLEQELKNSITHHALHRKSKYNPAILYKANKICRQYDIVHTHLRHVYAYIRLAQWLFGGKYKLIVHDHAGITKEAPKRFKGIFKPRYYIGVNKEQVNWARTVIGVDHKNTYLLENTILKPAQPIKQPSNKNKALLVANIRKVKNIEFAIALCKNMDWQLDIYGNTLEPDYYDQLQQAAGSTANIHSGVTHFNNIYPDYKLAIHSSHEETGPLVLIEYLSAGLPFIAYKTGSAAEAIAAELPELFMDNFEPEQWQTRIDEITADHTMPEKMRAVYQRKFDPEVYINKCLDIYKNVHS